MFVHRQPNYLRFILVFPLSTITHMLAMSFSVGQTWTWCCSLWHEGEAQKLPETPEPLNNSSPSRELGTLSYLPKQGTVSARRHFAFVVFNLRFTLTAYAALFQVGDELVQQALLPEPMARRSKVMLRSWGTQPAPGDTSPMWWKVWLCLRTGSVSCNLYGRIFSDVFLKTNLGRKLFKMKLR